jgi:hypothetical protein
MILETDKIPLIGVVGLNKENTDLAVYENPNQHCLNQGDTLFPSVSL